MEKSPIPNSPRKNVLSKEGLRDLALHGVKEKHKDKRITSGGRDSPESGSLYSDYESGQQYEQDLPSGYNSGEQYDTLSTGYMSGEAYELPETRQEPLEPTLASIEEVPTHSNEELFTIQMPDNQLLVQVDRLESSSSDSSIHDNLETAMAQDSTQHKGKKRKTVSYCVSVPMEKSPLGHDLRAYRELASDTDTTSCFDSDGTYMRGELQSSDSGAALLHHSTKKKRRDQRDGSEPGSNRSSRRKLRKAKQIIRNHDEFFLIYDNKYWATARTVCFWLSVLAIVVSIVTAAIMIVFMPHACDPEVPWWRGSVLVEIGPSVNGSDDNVVLDIAALLEDVPRMHKLGLKGVKLVNLYLKNLTGNASLADYSSYFYANDFDELSVRLGDLNAVVNLSQALHAANMSLIVDVPAMSANKTVEPELDFRITKAIQFWALRGVDGINLVGLDSYGADKYITDRISAWSTDFEKYSPRTHRIFITSYLFPVSIDTADAGGDIDGEQSVAGLSLLEADIDLSSSRGYSRLQDEIADINKWDKSPSQPWILWRRLGSGRMTGAELSFQMFLPGTIALPGYVLRQSAAVQPSQSLVGQINQTTSPAGQINQTVLAELVLARQSAVPIYMNGNYKACHGHCGPDHREDNIKITSFNETVVIVERHYNRRHRYMLIANFGNETAELESVAKIFSGGEVVVDTSGTVASGATVKFKNQSGIAPHHALVIKLPK